MTIDELIELLSDYRDELGGDTEIRLMTQPAWPFEHGILWPDVRRGDGLSVGAQKGPVIGA